MSNPTVNKALAVGGIIVGVLYMLNLGAGAIDVIPDFIPVVGNLDEAGATALILWGIQTFRAPANPPALPGERKRIQ